MAQLEVRTLQGMGSLTMEDKPLGKGGEGAVHSVSTHSVAGLPPASELVVKIYYKPEEGNRRDKLISMVKTPPDSEMFAWPLAVAAQNGSFVGYVMKKLKADQMKEWAHLAHTGTRREIAPEFDVRYAIAACLNYAIALDSLHRAGHMQGDANESNSFVGADASVIIVDTDSAQIKATDGRIFRCEVGKPEYTAPELIGRPLREQDRTEATDGFAFGVLLFQMLTGGAHQTDGIYTGTDDPPSTTSKISQGILPMLRDESLRGFAPVPRIAVAGISRKLRNLITALSDTEPSRRPSFERTIAAIRDVQSNLVQCDRDPAHWYDRREGSCGWCRHADSGQPDPWGKPRQVAVQSTLPPVSFGEQKAPSGQAPRASIKPARVQSGYAPTAVQQSFQPSSPTAAIPRRSSPVPSTPQVPTQLTPLAQQLLAQANGGYGAPATPASPAQVAPASPPAQTIPEKIRGKMVVTYADGTYGPRPPMGQLFKASPRLWRKAIAVEWPAPLRLWWRNRYDFSPSIPGIIFSPLFAILLLTIVSSLVNGIVYPLLDRSTYGVVQPLFDIGMLTSIGAFVIWWIGLIVGRFKYGGYLTENGWFTHLRALGISFFYLFTPVIVGATVLIWLLKTVIRGDRQTRYRR